VIRKWRYWLALFCCLGLCACGSDPEPSGAEETVVIGVIAPFKGPNAIKGREAFNGIDLELSEEPQLHDGRHIRVLYEHSAHDPVQAVAALRKLASDPALLAVVSFVDSDSMLAIAPVAEHIGIPVLVATATNPTIIKDRYYVSQLIFDDIFQGAVAALFTRDDLLIERVAILSNPRNTYSRFLGDEFARKFTSVGGEVVDRVSVYDNDFDLEAAMKRLKRARPQLLYMPLPAQQVIDIAQLLEQMNWRPRLLVSDGVLMVLVSEHQKRLRLVEGVIGTDVFSPKESMDKRDQFSRRYSLLRNTRADQVNTYSVLGIESMLLLRHAMNRCIDTGVDRQCVRRSIRTTRNLVGVVGPIDITPEGRAIRPLVINTIKNGRIVYRVRVH
jgi:branched-chain amino acid transport system substrate-binding protein